MSLITYLDLIMSTYNIISYFSRREIQFIEHILNLCEIWSDIDQDHISQTNFIVEPDTKFD
jgi:hypothetical protein